MTTRPAKPVGTTRPVGTVRTVGFAGLGVMGLPMAVNLANAGFDVVAWNRSAPARTAAADAGLTVVDHPAQLGRAAPVVFTMLPDLPQVEALLPDLLAEGSTLTTLVVLGTVSPDRVRGLANALRPQGVALVDAPVSGGLAGAREARLSIMVGADPDTFGQIQPYLDAMGSTVRRLGGVGAGSLTKACNQLVVAATLSALAEAVVLGERGGLDIAALLSVLDGGLASSEVLRQKRHHLTTGDFAGSGPAGYLVKDLRFALENAEAVGAVTPVTAAVAALYDTVVDLGLGQLDNSVVLDALRRLAAAPPDAEEKHD
jgi:3-hydroxyisobutyrate dehydrogenase-like beta-hydroxyacid dehydrogenase